MHKRILLICPFSLPNTGGVETLLKDLMSYLKKNGQGVDFLSYQPLTTNKSAPIFEGEEGSLIVRVPWFKFNLFYRLSLHPVFQLLYLSTGLGFVTIIYLLFNIGKYKALNFHGLATGVIGYIASYFYKSKYVLTLHTNYRFDKENWVGKVVVQMSKRYDEILVLSSGCKLNLIEIGVQEDKITSYFNWVNEQQFRIMDKQEARKRLGWDKKGFYALFIGRFSEEKGIFDLVKSLPSINKQINLIIIGGGDREKYVLEECKKYSNVSYLGRKSSTDLIDFYNASNILVHAPIDENFFSRVAIEALLCGLPIMVPTVSFYGRKKTKVTLKVKKNIGVVFENTPSGFAKMLNEVYQRRTEIRFSRTACLRYALSIYGEAVNGKIMYEALS